MFSSRLLYKEEHVMHMYADDPVGLCEVKLEDNKVKSRGQGGRRTERVGR